MRHLLPIVLACVLTACTACGPKNYQPPTDQENCAAACSHLRELGCEEGAPLEDGTTCEVFCYDNLEEGHSLNPTCVMQIQSCEEMEDMEMHICESK